MEQKLKKHRGIFAIIGIAVFFMLAVTACESPFLQCMLRKEKTGSTTTAPPNIAYEFVTIPSAGVITTDKTAGTADNPTVGSGNHYKGVFTTGRKVKLSPYAIGETEVTYEQWYEVYTWATGEAGGEGQPAIKYEFAHKGRAGSHGTDGAPPTAANKRHPVTVVSRQRRRSCVVDRSPATAKAKLCLSFEVRLVQILLSGKIYVVQFFKKFFARKAKNFLK